MFVILQNFNVKPQDPFYHIDWGKGGVDKIVYTLGLVSTTTPSVTALVLSNVALEL